MTTAVQPQFGDSQLANSQLVIVKTSLMLTSTSVSEVDNSDIHLHVQILLQSRQWETFSFVVPISKIRGKQLATCVIAKTGLMLTICSYNPGILQCIVGFRKKQVFGTFDHQKFRQFLSKGSILTVHGRFCLNIYSRSP